MIFMYKRKIDAILAAWKKEENHKPLIIKGIRQCGKTSSVKQFAANNYKNVIYLDFRENPNLIDLFDGSLKIDDLIVSLSANIPTARFEPKNTCIIFDEIQECPRARGSLKFFCIDGRYDVICTGSLLGVNGYKTPKQQERERKSSIPVGYEKIIDMYPMDFQEWLWANGITEEIENYLHTFFEKEEQIPLGIHQRMRQLWLEYTIVGGMPEVITTFLTTHDVNQTKEVQRGIIDGYKADMIKYARSEDQARIRECFESIPRQLSRENKKFTYAVVRHGGRSSDYQGSLQWIVDAGIAVKCHNLQITELPLDGNAIQEQFKVYMSDTGLFVSMLDEGTQSDILRGNLLSYKGAIFENLLADIFNKMGRKLYYFRKQDSLEIDFVIRYKGECTIVECKARTGDAKSMKTVLAHPEKYHVFHALKIGDYNIGRNNNTLTLPFYLAFMLTEI